MKDFYKRVSLIMFLCLFGFHANSINKYHKTNIIDSKEIKGLSVFNIILDNEGFVWFSTRKQIGCADGRNVKYFELKDNDGRQISLRKVEDQIWAFTDTGQIYFYDNLSDSFLPYYHFLSGEKFLLLNDIFVDQDTLWIATSSGLFRYNNGTQEQVDLYKGNFISKICSLDKGHLCIGTEDGLRFFDATNQSDATKNYLAKGEQITTIYKDIENSVLWVGTFSSGILVVDERTQKDITPTYLKNIPHVPIKVISQFEKDNLLIGLDGKGIYQVDTRHNKVSGFLYASNQPDDLLKDNGIYDILVDHNNIWVATYSDGISTIRYSNIFDWVKHIPYNPQSLGSDYVHAIYEDSDGDMWYATKSGVSQFQNFNQEWIHYFEGENAFLTIVEDNNNNIWCGGFSTGLFRINKRTKQVTHIKSLKNESQSDCIYASIKDEDGDLWFGGLYNPLTCVSKDKKGVDTYSFFDIYQVNSISEINSDSLFIASTSGFYIFNKRTEEWTHYFADPNHYNVESSSFIFSGTVVKDKIWFGTDGGGLNSFDMQTHEIDNFSTNNNRLITNYIYAIVKDDNNKLWLSTNNGIIKFEPETKQWQFNLNNLPTDQFVFNASAITRDGKIGFGSNDGALFFYPDSITGQKTTPKLFIRDIRLFYQKMTAKSNPNILSENPNDLSSIVFKHNQNTFSIDYICLDLYDPARYTYQYILEGFDNDWVKKDQLLSADYTNVPPGKYLFKLQCRDNTDGNIIGEREIEVTIKQPLWNTSIAWLIYLILIAILIYWVQKIYKDRLEKKQSDEKINFFINIAHDIRTPLSLIVAPLRSIETDTALSDNTKKHIQLAKQNCGKLTSVVNQLLELQKIEANGLTLDLTACNFKLYLQEHIKRFEVLALMKNIKIYTEFPDNDVLTMLDKSKMDSVINNILSNAIKYTNHNGAIRIILNSTTDICIQVQDNGIGIAKNEQNKIFNRFYRASNVANTKETGSGIGLVYTKKLVELMSGKLSFVSNENVGTTFFLTLPIIEVVKEEIMDEKDNIEEIDSVLSFTDVSNAKKRLDTYKILLVEDNDDMRTYLGHILSQKYNIHTESSATGALDYLKDTSVDLVISDVMMPGISGYEFCRMLKNNIETSHIQIILLTALADRDSLVVGLEQGADDYIYKPFDIDIVMAKVHNFMLTRKMMQQRYLTMNNLQIREDNCDRDAAQITTQLDNDFLNNAIQHVIQNIDNSNFSINELCQNMGMSRTLFYEKLKILTNQSPNEFIRNIRLKKAKELLSEHKYTIQQISEMTGFSDSKYFSTAFKKYFGESPSKV